MKNNSADKVHFTSVEELLGVSSAPVNTYPEDGKIVRLPLSVLHAFHSHPHGHPFRVIDDDRMMETAESIRQNGVLEPGIVRPDKDYPGEYEVIAGHRRWRGSELAGLSDMPFLFKNMSDYQATVIMADSNLHRDDILPSEIAWAYREKYEALKAMGIATDGERSDNLLAAEAGKSRNTIQRYISLTYLIPEMLQLVDAKKLGVTPAYDLTGLSNEEQTLIFDVITELKTVPSVNQSAKLKEFSKERPLTPAVVRYVLEKPEDSQRVSLPAKKIRSYFPDSYTGEEIQKVIFRLLEEWQAKVGES